MTLTKQHDLVGKLNNCVEERFVDLAKNKVLKCASIFHQANWNDNEKYGLENVKYLVDRFNEVLQTSECVIKNIQRQW